MNANSELEEEYSWQSHILKQVNSQIHREEMGEGMNKNTDRLCGNR